MLRERWSVRATLVRRGEIFGFVRGDRRRRERNRCGPCCVGSRLRHGMYRWRRPEKLGASFCQAVVSAAADGDDRRGRCARSSRSGRPNSRAAAALTINGSLELGGIVRWRSFLACRPDGPHAFLITVTATAALSAVGDGGGGSHTAERKQRGDIDDGQIVFDDIRTNSVGCVDLR